MFASLTDAWRFAGAQRNYAETPFDAHLVRRAAYWSLLVAPPAGVTYGAHGVWGWHLEERLPIDHLYTGIGPAWYDAMP